MALEQSQGLFLAFSVNSPTGLMRKQKTRQFTLTFWGHQSACPLVPPIKETFFTSVWSVFARWNSLRLWSLWLFSCLLAWHLVLGVSISGCLSHCKVCPEINKPILLIISRFFFSSLPRRGWPVPGLEQTPVLWRVLLQRRILWEVPRPGRILHHWCCLLLETVL